MNDHLANGEPVEPPPAPAQPDPTQSAQAQPDQAEHASTASESQTARVVFTPSGLSTAVPVGTTVLDAARQAGADLDSVCGGRGICGRCQIQPSIGQFTKWAIDSTPAALSTPGPTETDYHGRRPLADQHRLGCAATITCDVVVDIPPDSQIHRQVIRKVFEDHGPPLTLDPIDTIVFLTPKLPHLDGPTAATQIITEAWTSAGHTTQLEFDGDVIGALVTAITDQGTTLLVREARTPSLEKSPLSSRVTAAFAGYVDEFYGIAIDVGSTTIAAHLVRLNNGEVLASHGVMNPQIRLGEDLMSRVSHVMMHPNGATELTRAVRDALRSLTDELIDTVDPSIRPFVQQIVLVGNPIMVHLALGWDPTPLGMAPFTAATSDGVEVRASDIGIDIPMCDAYFLPCIAGHVGADTVAAILAHDPARSVTPTGAATNTTGAAVMVDVGTNAEIVLTVGTKRYAASSPTGPAFEGAQISCGQRAAAGAIERVRIDRHTLEPTFRIIGSDRWSTDDDFDAATEHLTISGVCGSGIVEVIGELFLAGVISADGLIDGSKQQISKRIVNDGRTFAYVLLERDENPLRITQADVRAIQLAKAALRAGIDLLMERAAIQPQSLRFAALAGAFGAHIDPLYAMVLGLVPDMDLAGVTSIGNAAGSGAVRALVSGEERVRADRIARTTIKIETATEERFQELFVNAIAFPHKTAPTTHLSALVDLPERRGEDGTGVADSNSASTTERRTRRRRTRENRSPQ